MTGLARAAGMAAVAIAAMLVGGAALPPAGGSTTSVVQATPVVELAGQSPVAVPGEAFTVQVRLEGIPVDGSLRLVLHQRVRSRSELAATMEGNSLRSLITQQVDPIAALEPDADGVRTLSLSLDPAAGGLPIPSQGVYPVAIRALDASGAEVASLITHLIAPPAGDDESPPLSVAVVHDLGTTTALQPDGTAELDDRSRADLLAQAGALAAAPGVPATVAVSPETIDALAATADPDDVALLDLLTGAVAERSVPHTPYVEVSPDALAGEDLLDELRRQLERGGQVLEDELGVSPEPTAWLARPDLGGEGLTALREVGITRAVVTDDQVEALDPGVLGFSLAQPFALAPPDDGELGRAESSGIRAMAIDPVVAERLDAPGSPALVVSRVLSEIAMVWLERPGIARALVVPIDAGQDPAVVTGLLEGLAAGSPFAPRTLAQAMAATEPVRDLAGNVVERALLPEATEHPLSATAAADLRAARRHLATFDGLLGGDSPRTAELERHLLLATAAALTAAERAEHVTAVETAIDEVAGAVQVPERATVTLTARDGTIPLTIRNDSGLPLQVAVQLESAKLEFPDGEELAVTLTEETTRIDLAVRARASGSFPLDVEITSPDGQRSLTSTRYTVQSTAVSGVGLVLSVGAGLFLIAWWTSHWRRTRRSDKLVTASHPSARPRHLSDG